MLDGPFTEAKELIGGWALLECRDMDEAVEWAKRFLAIAGDGESRIRQVAFERRDRTASRRARRPLAAGRWS